MSRQVRDEVCLLEAIVKGVGRITDHGVKALIAEGRMIQICDHVRTHRLIQVDPDVSCETRAAGKIQREALGLLVDPHINVCGKAPVGSVQLETWTEGQSGRRHRTILQSGCR